MKTLSDKQIAFCDEYLIDMNATQAAIRAGYSEKTAKQQGSRLLTNVDVQEYLASKSKQRSEKSGITAEWVLAQAAKSYEVNAQLISDKDGNLVQANPGAAKGFLELVGKHVEIGAFKDKVELSGGLALTHEEALKELE